MSNLNTVVPDTWTVVSDPWPLVLVHRNVELDHWIVVQEPWTVVPKNAVVLDP